MNIAGRLERVQEKKVISVFKRTARHIPFYRNYLKELGVDVPTVRTIRDFKALAPVLDKERLFINRTESVSSLCPDENLKNCRAILPSSGYSGVFSFSLIGRDAAQKQEKFIDNALDFFFNTSGKRTLLINALSMGITVPAQRVTNINTGLRSDIVLAVMKTLAREFEQIILVGENAFIKNILEDGLEQGVKWRDYRIHVIFGGESFPESFRAHIEKLLGISQGTKDPAHVGSSFGFAEIGLGVLWETPETVRIRKAAARTERLRKALFGGEVISCPILFQYDPMRLYVEEDAGKLLFTDIDSKTLIPIIRYRTGDEGFIIPFEKLKAALREFGFSKLLPRFGLPLVAVTSRGQFVEVKGVKIYPNMVQEALYSDAKLPRLVTGYFRMRGTRNKLNLEMQLKKNVDATKKTAGMFKKAFNKYLSNYEIKLYPYKKFPYAMELDYERKFRYID